MQGTRFLLKCSYPVQATANPELVAPVLLGEAELPDALKLSRLEPEQQEDAASQLVSGKINSLDEYKPYSVGNKVYATLEESIADLKNPDKDGTCTPDMFLIALDGLVGRFHRDFAWYSDPECAAVFPQISEEQFEFVKKRAATVTSTLDGLVAEIERRLQND